MCRTRYKTVDWKKGGISASGKVIVVILFMGECSLMRSTSGPLRAGGSELICVDVIDRLQIIRFSIGCSPDNNSSFSDITLYYTPF